MISRCSWVVGYILGVGSSSFISDFSDISIISIGSVCDMLCAAIRKSNRIRTNSISISSTGFSSIEGSLRVVISNSIFKSVGLSRTIIGRSSGMMDYGSSVVGRGTDYWSVDNWDMVGRGTMNYWCMVGWGTVNNW